MKFNHATSAAMSSGRGSRDDYTLDSSRLEMRVRKPGDPNSKDFRLQELAMLSLSPIFRSIQNWWLQRAERHYLICADVEQQRAREAQANVAYYQKRAALARSARL
ncbi:hypothetical protein E4K72_22710 [Oxalobacteraceae bacterium OM1]|nr:hypothetical protein E4K72_22710 [Oxalobacteraceae bacterium OM1]